MYSKRLLISIIAVCTLLVAGATVLVKSARKKVAASECSDNLERINGGKHTWALESGNDPGAKPTWDDICWYTGVNGTNECPLRCPSGGTYVIGEVAHPAICSVHGFLIYAIEHLSGHETKGIPGAVVETLYSDGHKAKTCTDAIGRALVKAPEKQTATVIISKPGYVTVSNSIGSLYSNVSVALERVRK